MTMNFFKFIKKLFLVSLPIIIQQLFLNLASLLDTLMVGQLDEASISGVYIATQIVFVIKLRTMTKKPRFLGVFLFFVREM